MTNIKLSVVTLSSVLLKVDLTLLENLLKNLSDDDNLSFFFAAQAASSFFFLWGYLTKHMGFSWSVFLQCKHWSDNNVDFDLSQKAITMKLLLFFILASSINSAIKKLKVEVVTQMNWHLAMTKALNVNSRLLRRTVSITQSEKVEFISCKHCDEVFSWST